MYDLCELLDFWGRAQLAYEFEIVICSSENEIVKMKKSAEAYKVKHLHVIPKTKQNWTETKKFYIYFCTTFDHIYQSFISESKTGH